MEDRTETTPEHLPLPLVVIGSAGEGEPPRVVRSNLAARALFGVATTEELEQLELTRPFRRGLAALLSHPLRPHLDHEGLLYLAWGSATHLRVRPTVRRHDGLIWVLLDTEAQSSESQQAVLDHIDTLEAQVRHRAVRAERRTEELRAMALEAVHAEEKERTRIARLLHDGLQQLLVAARIHASTVAGLADEERRARTGRILIELVDASIDASRALTEELGSTTLTHGDLPAALERLGRWMEKHHDLKLELEIEAQSGRPDRDVARLMLRCARELLFNVTKHAGTDRAELHLGREVHEGEIVSVMTVRDGGNGGATLGGSNNGTGLGLGDLARRVTLVGGTFELDSPQGGGTVAVVRVPWRQAREPRTARPGGPISVVLVDDHDLVRESIAAALAEEDDLQIVGEAADGPVALELVRKIRPQVVIMDVDLPSASGIELTRMLTSEQVPSRILGLSMHDDPSVERAMLAAGARAFLSKGGPMEDLIQAIRSVVDPPPHHATK